ncbi:MAG TPA: sigma-70 family RNA polymerase sigma factor, partial [Ignavibacteriaceae bacterium]|nr:sigma-70 family RNA polymerase sigma factor [Ignavibacteriaceae bacterium]
LDDDFSLIKRFNNGDETAFRTLVSRHKDKVRNLIYLTLGNTDAIDDISQDVFVSVYRKLKTFRFESQFTTWLYRITVNKCRDHLRKIKIRSIFSPFTNEEDTLIAPEQLPDDFDIKIIVRQAIAKLPEKLKVPLILKDFDGLSYQEISETMGVEIGTIKSRIFRAREGLKKILAPYQKELL